MVNARLKATHLENALFSGANLGGIDLGQTDWSQVRLANILLTEDQLKFFEEHQTALDGYTLLK